MACAVEPGHERVLLVDAHAREIEGAGAWIEVDRVCEVPDDNDTVQVGLDGGGRHQSCSRELSGPDETAGAVELHDEGGTGPLGRQRERAGTGVEVRRPREDPNDEEVVGGIDREGASDDSGRAASSELSR